MKTTKILSAICIMLMFSMVFQNVSAQIETYTIDDDGRNITINSGQIFNTSIEMGGMYIWKISSYDSSIIEIIDEGYWSLSQDPEVPSGYYNNWTFRGKGAGTTVLSFDHMILGGGNDTIDDTFNLSVTVIQGPSPNYLMIIIVFSIITVIPSVIIIKWMKGEEKHE